MENRQELKQQRRPVVVEEDKRKPKDYMTFMITIQTVLCILLFVGVLVFSKMGGQSYQTFRNEMKSIMSYDMGVSGIKDAFNSIVEFVMAPADQWQGEGMEKSAAKPQKESVPQKGGIGSPEVTIDGDVKPKNSSFSPYTITVGIVNPVKNGKISSKFGYRKDPFTKKLAFHSGLDIAASKGTRIAAAYSGKVKKIGEDSMAGNYIYLEHSNGMETLYCHCSEIIAQEGANIRAGETIAKVGSTGYSTGPHVHFEIRINGVKYDPLIALKDAS